MRRQPQPKVLRNVALILGGFVLFALVGFFLPFLFRYAAASINAAVDPNFEAAQSPEVPLELSVILAVLLGTGAAVGLTLQAVFKGSRST